MNEKKALITKDDVLAKLRSYREVPDDENIQYKQKIKNALMLCPELLYALNNEELETELFDEDGNINWKWDEELNQYEPQGEWDRYFGDSANIRPELFFPETESETKHFICYQVMFDEVPKYNKTLKYTEVKFTIFCQERDVMDKETGIPRHDLIASIIRERFNWSNIFGSQAKLTSSKESITDNHYLVRTLVFEVIDTNGIYNTTNGSTNYQVRR